MPLYRTKRKLCFPFQFATTLQELRGITSLPDRKYFVSSLTGTCANKDEYENVSRIWKKVYH